MAASKRRAHRPVVLHIGHPEVEAVVHRDVQAVALRPGPAAAGRRRAGRSGPTMPGSASSAALSTAPRSRDGSPKLCCTCRPSQIVAAVAHHRRRGHRQQRREQDVLRRCPSTVSGAVAAGTSSRSAIRSHSDGSPSNGRATYAAVRAVARRRGRPCSACRSRTGRADAGRPRPRRARSRSYRCRGPCGTSWPWREPTDRSYVPRRRAGPACTPGGR